jgi:murein DD-endopeptidase MepM/ murein hydrolase activator NlpD
MRRGAWSALALCVCLLPAAPVRAAEDPASLQEQMAQLSAQMQQLQAAIQQDSSRLQQARAAAAYWERRRGEAESTIAADQKAVSELQARLQALGQQLAQVTADLQAHEQRLARLQREADASLRDLYEGGTASLLGVLLGSTTFSDFLSRFHFLETIFAAQVATMRQVRAERAAIAQRQAQLAQQRAQLAAVRAEVEQSIAKLQRDAAAYEQSKSAAQAQARLLEEQLQAEQQASEEVTRELRSLQVRYQRATGKLTFVWPLPPPYRITSPFGPRYIQLLHRSDFHTGIDIAEPTGTPIRAAADGVVVVAGWLGGYGNAVVVYHGKVDGHDYYTLYAHQSRIAVRQGEQVQQGQILGYVGMTGNATGPHLHFEVRVDGEPVDPMPYLPPADVIRDY